MPPDFFELGYQHFLIIQNVPDIMASRYPTQDKHSPEDEAEFIRGFNQAKADLEKAKEEVRIFGESLYD